MTEKELMMIKRDLQKRAKKMGLGKKRSGAYVFGTLRKIRGNPVGWIDRAEKIINQDGENKSDGEVLDELYNYLTSIPKSRRNYLVARLIKISSPSNAGNIGSEGATLDEVFKTIKKYRQRALRGNPANCETITSTDWNDRENTLVFEKNMKPVCMGQKVRSRETYVVTGGQAPHKPSSSGRVYVKQVGEGGWGRQFFPNVFKMIWVPSYNLFPIDKVTQEPRFKLRTNPACMRSLQANGGKTKTWKLGEYASGGIIQAKVSGDGNAVAIRVLDYITKEGLDGRVFRWPLDRFSIEMYLNELTTSYYSNVILDWIASAAK